MGTCCLTNLIMAIFLGIYAFNNPDVNPKQIFGEVDMPLNSSFNGYRFKDLSEGDYATFECYTLSNGSVSTRSIP